MIRLMSSDNANTATIRIAAALLMGEDGRMLLVRKRGTRAFMQPGGKIEPHEEPAAALVREIHEELGLVVPRTAVRYLARHFAPAAHEPGFSVDAQVFLVVIAEEVAPAAEIEEILWIDPATPPDIAMAPLTRDHILPLCLSLSKRAAP